MSVGMKAGRLAGAMLLGMLALLASPSTSSASLIFSGSGSNPETGHTDSGTAEFSISGDVLTIVLTNTTAGGSLAQGDALMGLIFDVNGTLPSLSLSSINLTAGSSIYTAKTTINNAAPLSGSWTSSLADGAAPDFGIAATGFAGLFKAGTLTRGNGSPDYGLIADGTSLASGFPKFPYINDSLTFVFTGATGLTESNLTNVKFLFGTDGTGVVPGTPPDTTDDQGIHENPEPGSLALAAIGLTALGGGYARRRKQRAAA